MDTDYFSLVRHDAAAWVTGLSFTYPDYLYIIHALCIQVTYKYPCIMNPAVHTERFYSTLKFVHSFTTGKIYKAPTILNMWEGLYLTHHHCSLLKANIVGGVIRTKCVYVQSDSDI